MMGSKAQTKDRVTWQGFRQETIQGAAVLIGLFLLGLVALIAAVSTQQTLVA